MKVLITGANGFLGYHLAKHFARTGNEIYAISRNTSRLVDIIEDINFRSSKLSSITGLMEDIKVFDPEVAIHCAWDGGNSFQQTQDVAQFHGNLPGLVDLMSILHQCPNFEHFVGIGSGAEYGNLDFMEQIGEDADAHPDTLYGATKLMAKIYTETYCQAADMSWAWLRPFYVYGPQDVESRLIPKAILHSLNKTPLPLDTCNRVVDYLYIDDFVSAVDSIVSQQAYGVFNVCSSQAYDIKDVLRMIEELSGAKEIMQFGRLPERKYAPKNTVGNNHSLKTLTDWEPKVSLRDGLMKTIDSYKL